MRNPLFNWNFLKQTKRRGISPKKRAMDERKTSHSPQVFFRKPTRPEPSYSLYSGVIVVCKRKMKAHSFFRNDLIIFRPLKVKQKTLPLFLRSGKGLQRNNGLAGGHSPWRHLAYRKDATAQFSLTAGLMMVKLAAILKHAYLNLCVYLIFSLLRSIFTLGIPAP